MYNVDIFLSSSSSSLGFGEQEYIITGSDEGTIFFAFLFFMSIPMSFSWFNGTLNWRLMLPTMTDLTSLKITRFIMWTLYPAVRFFA